MRKAWLCGAMCFSVLNAPVVLACEPAEIDFELFLQANDRNRDQHLDLNELLNASFEGQFVRFDEPINTKEAFQSLDKNKDGALSLEELWEWVRYAPDACRGWPGRGR